MKQNLESKIGDDRKKASADAGVARKKRTKVNNNVAQKFHGALTILFTQV